MIELLNLRRISQLALLTLALAAPILAATPAPTLLDAGFHQMYDLQFDAAHKTFADYQRVHPNDPMGPVSDAAASSSPNSIVCMFWSRSCSSMTTSMRIVRSWCPTPTPDVSSTMKLLPGSEACRHFPRVREGASQCECALCEGAGGWVRGDYTALIEKKDLKALSIVKEGRAQAESLLKIDPNCFDAYIAVGVENYLLSLKPAPVRWFLKMTGAQTDKQIGIEKLQLTAANGHYLKPYARMLLAVAALRDKDEVKARELLSDLSAQYPNNRLYAKELAKLNTTAQTSKDYGTH